MIRWLRAALIAVLLVGLLTPASGAQGAGPTVTALTPRVAPGGTFLVRLVGWTPGSPITVSICGNDARRGSQDCDLSSSESVPGRTSGEIYLRMHAAVPPAPCPCVLRAFDVASNTVATTPFEVIGVAVAPTVGPDPAAAPLPLSIAATLHREHGSFLDRLRQVLGGPSPRQLELVVHNESPNPLPGVVVTAALGRHSTGGAPLDAPAPFDLAVGESRTILVPVRLEAPVHGHYVVVGRAFWGGLSAPYAVSTTATPWGLVVLVVLALLAFAAAAFVALRRRRQDRERRPDGLEERMTTATETFGKQGLVASFRPEADS